MLVLSRNACVLEAQPSQTWHGAHVGRWLRRHKSVLRRYKGGMREVLGDGTIHPYRVVHEHVLW